MSLHNISISYAIKNRKDIEPMRIFKERIMRLDSLSRSSAVRLSSLVAVWLRTTVVTDTRALVEKPI